MTTTATSLGTCQYADDCTEPATTTFDDEIVGPTPTCAAHAAVAAEAEALEQPAVDHLEQQARDLLAKGKSVQYICDLTGYPRGRVEQLAAEVGRPTPVRPAPPAASPAAPAPAATAPRSGDGIDATLRYAESGSRRAQAAAKRARDAIARVSEIVVAEEKADRERRLAAAKREEALAELRAAEAAVAAAKAKLGRTTSRRASEPTAKKGRSWSPEQRAAAAERMRQRNAARAAERQAASA